MAFKALKKCAPCVCRHLCVWPNNSHCDSKLSTHCFRRMFLVMICTLLCCVCATCLHYKVMDTYISARITHYFAKKTKHNAYTLFITLQSDGYIYKCQDYSLFCQDNKAQCLHTIHYVICIALKGHICYIFQGHQHSDNLLALVICL